MKMKNKYNLKMVVAIFLISTIFITLSSMGDNGFLNQVNQVFSPLPKIMVSVKNPVTPEKVRLGKILFYETRISVDGTVSCVRCHPFSLYGADGLRKSIGNNCKINQRNAPTILNASGQISAHWIGNRIDVEDQAKQSVVGHSSFGMPSYEDVVMKIKDINGYGPLFKAAFPENNNPVTMDNFAKAIGAFERTLVTPSRFDDFLAGKTDILTDQEKKGVQNFMEVGCSYCHSGSYVGGQEYRKFGLKEPYWKYTKSETIDEGRFIVTKQESDKYVFKVPILRNVAKTSPYFHDGSVTSLEQVIWIMGKIQIGIVLSKDEIENIDTFLKSLTGKIPQDALMVPLIPSIE